MEVNISGLKCDYCTYRDDSVIFAEYKDSIDKPCPKCGNSLLTIFEYNNCLKLINFAEQINYIEEKLKWLNPMFYIRKIFKIKRKEYNVTVEFPKRKI